MKPAWPVEERWGVEGGEVSDRRGRVGEVTRGKGEGRKGKSRRSAFDSYLRHA